MTWQNMHDFLKVVMVEIETFPPRSLGGDRRTDLIPAVAPFLLDRPSFVSHRLTLDD